MTQAHKRGEADSGRTGSGIELSNPERGCGYLKPNKAYLRADVGSGGSGIPSFVEFQPPIPFKEDRKRSYTRFPGLQFELTATGPDGLTTSVPSDEVQRHINRLNNDRPTGAHAGAMATFNSHDLLLSVGKSHYPTVEAFVDEAKIHGVSKAISVTSGNEPPVINPARTRLFLIHPNACRTEVETEKTYGEMDDEDELIAIDGEEVNEEDPLLDALDEDTVVTIRKTVMMPGIIGYTYLTRVVYTEDEDGEVPEYIEKYEKQGSLEVAKPGSPEPYSSQPYYDDEGNLTKETRKLLDDWEETTGEMRRRSIEADGDIVEAYKAAYESAQSTEPEPTPDDLDSGGRGPTVKEDPSDDIDELEKVITGAVAGAGWVEAEAPPEDRDRLLNDDGDVLAIVEFDDERLKVVSSTNFNVKKSPEQGHPFYEGVGVIGPYRITVKDENGDRSFRVVRTR